MDWFLDPTTAAAAHDLRHELVAFLRRHGDPASDFGAAEVAFGEVIANVARHTEGPAWISLDWSGESPTLTVRDLGPGFEPRICLPEPLSCDGRGLYLVAHLSQELAVAARRRGGSAVSVVLPVRRARDPGIGSPPTPRKRALPSPEEADADGCFGKESFLTALLVQLAQHVELEQGPEAIQTAVAQVGMDVGSRIEEEYRRVHSVTGRLSPEQIADLCVRLKGALGGDFYVIEASEHRIVLGNRRCPFGDAVMRAPGLCRMTSSVLGGIAARNTGAGAVELEERIAVGDPECRVIVWLGPPAETRPADASPEAG